MKSVGWIGLGYMGSRLAKRLMAAGYGLTVYNRDRAKTDAFAALGARVAATPAEVAKESDLIFSCLTDGLAIRSVYFGDEGVIRNARRGTRIVEMSTVAPETARHLSRAGRERGIAVLDVAISGSGAVVENGAITLFGGGDRAVFEELEPVFPAIARQWFYMGPAGSGLAMKLVVNALLGVGMQAIAEALALGSALGLPREELFETLSHTAVVAPAIAGKLPAAARHDYSSQFPLRLMHKDFRLVLTKADQLGVSMPATREASEWNEVEATRDGDEDFSAVIRLMEQRATENITAA